LSSLCQFSEDSGDRASVGLTKTTGMGRAETKRRTVATDAVRLAAERRKR
jgi:hypothetical protein